MVARKWIPGDALPVPARGRVGYPSVLAVRDRDSVADVDVDVPVRQFAVHLHHTARDHVRGHEVSHPALAKFFHDLISLPLHHVTMNRTHALVLFG